MKSWLLLLLSIGFFGGLPAQQVTRKLSITGPYLNLPVAEDQPRERMTLSINGQTKHSFVIRLTDQEPDYWVFTDLSDYQGEELTITYAAPVDLKVAYTADTFAGQDSVYQEVNRPQFHFSSRRGWNNDPNGLVYDQGEYHLFYQHNPYEANWENMHWGHAVSKDLLHWEELGDVLFPDELGTMFSGTATVDANNTAGFQTGEDPPLVAAYTAHLDKGGTETPTQTQCIAYSNDKGRTWTKYEGNPVINSKSTWHSPNTRDPKIFWYEPTQKWVMVLFERDGHSIYNSNDLTNWTYHSHIGGFWECPELFELPVDGNNKQTKWVMYGASGTYMIGDFDGRKFTVESGKHRYVEGGIYAAQTYNNIPAEDGRRIQFGWAQVAHPGMPFKHMMTVPTELTLRSTRNGIRLFNEPIDELEALHTSSQIWENLTPAVANEKLAAIEGDLLRVHLEVRINDGVDFSLLFKDQAIVTYDMNHNLINDYFYESDHSETQTIVLELLLDRTSAEIFVDRGAFTVLEPLEHPQSDAGLTFEENAAIDILFLAVHQLDSIWD